MTDPAIALRDYLRKMSADLDGDFLRESVQLPRELEAEDH